MKVYIAKDKVTGDILYAGNRLGDAFEFMTDLGTPKNPVELICFDCSNRMQLILGVAE